ncbi:MAG: hypothetical protein GTN62_07570 [Gemmatimonadales bacterium]|nr:hypothetical protein [Gemmatimonadales bacterium]NIN11349.1 hypothetical protein [Gemmatimonadales bacterium]NIN49959.1 hypothetical protein [Gemmatimonadales bacterium]NIP07423.1 hypothetical protein [Gemmatimonadales bacterium]NIR00490.1 hypothetical protein [Gemmatimonadales bacterium]
MIKPKCAVSGQRSELEEASRELKSTTKIGLAEFDPTEGYEWPVPEENKGEDEEEG